MAQKIEDVKTGMTKEDVLEIAGKPLSIIFIGIDKTTADSLFSYEYNEKHFIYFLGNKVEGIDLDTASNKIDAEHNMEKAKLQVDSLINRKEQK
ncbi:MAG: hypothetical protein IPO63_09755 [Bacteroidetes bacterium]|nr:hypothetical protein [Bacteroidota bacterium]